MKHLYTKDINLVSPEQLMRAMDLEERHLKTNQAPVCVNPDDYEAYLDCMCGRDGYVMSESEWENNHE